MLAISEKYISTAAAQYEVNERNKVRYLRVSEKRVTETLHFYIVGEGRPAKSMHFCMVFEERKTAFLHLNVGSGLRKT